MSHPTRKLFIFLIVVITLVGLLFVKQIRKTIAITTETKQVPLVALEPTVLPINSDDPVFGNPGAPLTLVAFLDIGQADSNKLFTTLTQFIKKHPTEARLIWKDYPEQHLFLSNHNLAHQAAFCTRQYKTFWPFVETVINTKNGTREKELQNIAANLKLPSQAWWQCALSDAAKVQVETAMGTAHTLELPRPPVLFVNNRWVNLGEDINLTQMLDSFIVK